jgi:hypothetical protein
MRIFTRNYRALVATVGTVAALAAPAIHVVGGYSWK